MRGFGVEVFFMESLWFYGNLFCVYVFLSYLFISWGSKIFLERKVVKIFVSDMNKN